MIDDLAEEGNAMAAILSKLFGQMRNIQRASVRLDAEDS
jgi:hypothetical protein